MLSPTRRCLKRFHPEGIPWPASAFYDAVSRTSIFQRQYEFLAKDIAGRRAEGSVLDIGTGPGQLLLHLHRQAPRLHLTGLDASPAMVAAARKHVENADLSARISVVEGNASALPFPDASFDMVVSTGSMHHWKEPALALNEVYRVLKTGGEALMYDLVSDTPAAVLQETAREFGRLRVLLFWLHSFEEPFYTRADFASLARSTPFHTGATRFVGVLCCLALQKDAKRP